MLSDVFGYGAPTKPSTPQFYNATNGPNWDTDCNKNHKTPCACKDGDDNYVTCKNGHITKIHLSGNDNMKGKVPLSFWNFTKLTLMDLGHNGLTGTIPSAVGQLKEVTGLYIGGNPFEGTIPSEIGNLDKLTGLHLDELRSRRLRV